MEKIKLMPSDKIAVTLILKLLKNKKEIEIEEYLIKQNEPFIDRHYRYTFIKKVKQYIKIAIAIKTKNINYQTEKKQTE